MKNRTKKLSALSMMFLSACTFTGCIDNNYDLNGVDMTVGIGNGEIKLPSCSTDRIQLDEVLELNNSETVVEKENGDYFYIQNGNDVAATETKIDAITVAKRKGESQDFNFSLASYVQQSRRRNAARNISINMQESRTVYSFQYKGDMPAEVEELLHAQTDGSISVNAAFSSAVKAYAPTIAEVTIELPSFLTIGEVSSTQQYTKVGSKLIFKNVNTADNLKVNFKITDIDFSNNTVETLGKISTANKTIEMDADIKMGLHITNIVTGNTTEDPAQCSISSDMSIDNNMTIKQVRGRFNPSVTLDNLGSTTVNGIPDFLTNDGVVIDIDNPQIMLNISSDLEIPGFISGKLIATKGNSKKTVSIPEFNIAANATSKICICRNMSKINSSEYTSVVGVANLSDILNPIPDKIEFVGDARADKNVVADFELGKKYTLKPSYRIEAPLAFGENAKIVYTDSFDDFNSDIKDIDVTDGSYIEMTGDVDNMIPAYLNASAVAIDIDGNEMPASEVKVDVVGEIAASTDGVTAKTSALKVTMTPNKGALKKLDGLKFTVSGAAKAEGDGPTVTGQTLNAKKHALVVRNINIKFVGKAIADLN